MRRQKIIDAVVALALLVLGLIAAAWIAGV